MAIAADERVPPFLAGDMLTRDEFLRRWKAHPEIKKAELIKGMVFMPSPVSVEHSDMEGSAGIWLGTYRVATPGTASGHSGTSFLLDDAPQPDLNLRILAEWGGGSRVEGDYLHGAPELLVEICRSSAVYDLHVKHDLYEAAGVPEYLAILLFEREIRWHILDDGKYRLISPDAEGIWRSRVFPGLRLDGRALLAGDMPAVLHQLQEGIRSPEHQRFVANLAARSSRS